MSSATAGKGRAAQAGRARSLLAENVRLKPGNADECRLCVLSQRPALSSSKRCLTCSLSLTRAVVLCSHPLARLVTL